MTVKQINDGDAAEMTRIASKVARSPASSDFEDIEGERRLVVRVGGERKNARMLVCYALSDYCFYRGVSPAFVVTVD